jgi:hypothetical protein
MLKRLGRARAAGETGGATATANANHDRGAHA